MNYIYYKGLLFARNSCYICGLFGIFTIIESFGKEFKNEILEKIGNFSFNFCILLFEFLVLKYLYDIKKNLV